MPVRDGNNQPTETSRTGTTPKRDRLVEIGQIGAMYLRLKKEEKDLSAKIAKENTKLKEISVKEVELFTPNGKHKELYAPLGDGINELFIQIQMRESISMDADIIAKVREKLGKKADNFIMITEVLHQNSLESMLNQGLITPQDILDWTSTRTTKSLIVKANKKRPE